MKHNTVNISTFQQCYLVSQHYNISTLQLVSQHSTFQHLHFVSTFQHFNISFTIHKLNISTFRFLNIATFNMLIQHSTLEKANQTSLSRYGCLSIGIRSRIHEISLVYMGWHFYITLCASILSHVWRQSKQFRTITSVSLEILAKPGYTRREKIIWCKVSGVCQQPCASRFFLFILQHARWMPAAFVFPHTSVIFVPQGMQG